MNVDLFAGAGGASLAMRRRWPDVELMAVEWDQTAAATHLAALGSCVEADVRLLPVPVSIEHLHGSPPCTTWSKVGSGRGRVHLDDVCAAVGRVLTGEPHGLTAPDATTLLTLEPARWIYQSLPATISMEQVVQVLPVWEAYAAGLQALGYDTWTGNLSAETFGAPQTRVRAYLLAARDGHVEAPVATHSSYRPRSPGVLDGPHWQTMAEALGWPGADEVPDYKAWLGDRVNDQSGTPIDWSWPARRPALTIAGRPLATNPGPNANRFNGSTKSRNDGIRITVAEAAVLQGFPADWPWQGPPSSQILQVGNACQVDAMLGVLRGLTD